MYNDAMEKLKTSYQNTFLGVIVTLAVLFIINAVYVQAWSWSAAPPNPPSGNVPAPINVGDQLQFKQGALQALEFRSNRYCDADGNNCVSTPGGGMGGSLNLPTGTWFHCPYVDLPFRYDHADCGSSCTGQISSSPVCLDYGQIRISGGRHRCAVRAQLNCTQIAGPPVTYSWHASPWSHWHHTSDCWSSWEQRTRTVDCRMDGTGIVFDPSFCSGPAPTTIETRNHTPFGFDNCAVWWWWGGWNYGT